ncbi:MAG: D-3-phosphoglycerate dehydrogenase [Verrucomicrobiota bacterium]|jgi:D-3-phosphoglycerate dehydrogenase
MKILLTTTSFQDTPGPHHEMLAAKNYEIVRERGPLTESRMLELAGDFDAFLCGDDAITRAVLEKSLPRLKVVAKYGIGLDKVDVAAATDLKLPVTFCPGVNHTTVAEHTFGLLLAIYRDIVEQGNAVREGKWKRLTGHELMGKTIGIAGLGRIGKEVAIRAKAFGMEVLGFDLYWDEEFAKKHGITRVADVDDLIRRSDIVSLHMNLTPETKHFINAERLKLFKKNAVLLNCARGELVEGVALAAALDAGQIAGYGADVLDEEPPKPDHPLLKCRGSLITPHIGSRTYESVVRQATMAAQNMINVLEGKPAVAQANKL